MIQLAIKTIVCLALLVPLAHGETDPYSKKWVSKSSWLPNNIYLTDVDCPTAAVCYAVGYDSVRVPMVYKSTDSGDYWEQMPFENRCYYASSVKFVSQDTGYIACGGLFLRTYNGGRDWDTGPPGRGVSTFAILNKKKIVGLSGDSIAISLDEGRTWRMRPSPITAVYRSLFSLSFPDSMTGFAVGPFGIVKTSDGGESWSWIDGELRSLNGVDFPTRDTGFIVSDLGRIYRTTDGAVSWMMVYDNYQSRRLRGIDFLNSQLGYVVGDGVNLVTEDGGGGWFSYVRTDYGGNYLTDVCINESESGIIVGFYTTILKLVGIEPPQSSRRRAMPSTPRKVLSAQVWDILGRQSGFLPSANARVLFYRNGFK